MKEGARTTRLEESSKFSWPNKQAKCHHLIPQRCLIHKTRAGWFIKLGVGVGYRAERISEN